MRKIGQAALIAALAAASACNKTGDGDVVVERPGDVDVRTTQDTIQTPNMPDIDVNMKKDTLVVNRPSVSVKRDTTKKP